MQMNFKKSVVKNEITMGFYTHENKFPHKISRDIIFERITIDQSHPITAHQLITSRFPRHLDLFGALLLHTTSAVILV